MKNVLITGGAGGIGTALCKAFAREGCGVAVHYHSKKEKAEQLAAGLRNQYGVRAIAVQADVSDRASVSRLFDAVDDALGSLELLVNNAGIAQQKLFTDITDNDWNSMISTNLSGVFYCCQEALKRYMIPSHSGVILNISSMWGQVGASCEVHYSAAKAGVIGLTKALAKEVGLSNIRVNCIAPGPTQTGWIDAELEKAVLPLIPMGKLIQPENIAETILFLASEQAQMLTGQVIKVSGGHALG